MQGSGKFIHVDQWTICITSSMILRGQESISMSSHISKLWRQNASMWGCTWRNPQVVGFRIPRKVLLLDVDKNYLYMIFFQFWQISYQLSEILPVSPGMTPWHLISFANLSFRPSCDAQKSGRQWEWFPFNFTIPYAPCGEYLPTLHLECSHFSANVGK